MMRSLLKTKRVLRWVALSAMLPVAAIAQTTNVGPVTFTSTLNFSDPGDPLDYTATFNEAGSYSITENDPVIGIGYSTFTASFVAGVSGNLNLKTSTSIVTQAPNELTFFGVAQTLTGAYSFEVVGPSGPSVPVEIAVTLSGSVGGNGSDEAMATFSVANGGSSDNRSVCSGDYCTAGSQPTLSENVAVLETPGVPDTIDISASSFSQLGFEGQTIVPATNGRAIAFADPYIFIDPTFANAAAYSIVVSPGVGNSPSLVTAVPEPSTYVAMLIGLGMLGFIRRRERQPLSALNRKLVFAN